ncbi:MAG: site-specific DNA-methyltransferase [Bacteroidia bacterium]|nr:site-specific DNA-methyltransferase [Bacteroidia bacterium]
MDRLHQRKSIFSEQFSFPSPPFYEIPNKLVLFQGDFLALPLPPQSIDLIITSPPYNVGVAYGTYEDDMQYEAYLDFTNAWLSKAYQLLRRDGRLCLNIPIDKNKGGQQSVYADIVSIAKHIGYKYHATIIWNEGNISRRTAWGSWKSARAPYVIAPVEAIVILYKEVWRKEKDGESDITREEFIEWTMGVWSFSGESKKEIGHPAPFPEELPKRCIKLFSYVGDVVLDPFVGSGTTLLAALKLRRQAIGIEIEPAFCEIAKRRIIQAASDLWLQSP